MSKARKGKIKQRKRSRRLLRFLFLLMLIGGASYIAAQIPMPHAPVPARSGIALKDVQSWGYQLQKVRASRIPAGMDLLVVDYSRDGSDGKAFTKRQVNMLRLRPDGSKRIVLAYLSIGEAESYRFYWWRIWRFISPPWLGRENEQWKGNYPVRFWQRGWQDIIMRQQRSALDALLEYFLPWRKAYIDKILEAGFDGIYLDRVDVFGEWNKIDRDADKDMVRFVALLSAYSKSRKLGFLVVPQNGEELLRFKNYRRVIDGFAKEDLFYGIEDDGEQNASSEINKTLRHMNRASRDGLPVFVVEYLESEKRREHARKKVEERGYLLNFAERALDRPPELLQSKISSDGGSPNEKQEEAAPEVGLTAAPAAPSATAGGSGGQNFSNDAPAGTASPAVKSPSVASPAVVPPIKREKPGPFSVK